MEALKAIREAEEVWSNLEAGSAFISLFCQSLLGKTIPNDSYFLKGLKLPGSFGFFIYFSKEMNLAIGTIFCATRPGLADLAVFFMLGLQTKVALEGVICSCFLLSRKRFEASSVTKEARKLQN